MLSIAILTQEANIEHFSTWPITEYTWVYSLASIADTGLSEPDIFKTNSVDTQYHNIHKISHGIIWTRPDGVDHIVSLLPQIEHVIIIISDSDTSISEIQQINVLLNSQKVYHIFAQNCDISHDKITKIPIGIDYHTLAYRQHARPYWSSKSMTPYEQEKVLTDLITIAPATNNRKIRIFVDFNINDSMRPSFSNESRTAIFKRILPSGVVDYAPGRTTRINIWNTKIQYAFSVSPHGWGLDCHRTWEDLALGCIVIVKTSKLDDLYDGLPVVIIRDWSEITQQNLEQWLLVFGDVLHNPAYRIKLKTNYWHDKIREKQNHIRTILSSSNT